jgi:DNA replication protein DnaC
MSITQTKPIDIDRTREKLESLGLQFAAQELSLILADAVQNESAPHQILDKLLAFEIERREERRLAGALRLSGLPSGQTLQSFDFTFQPSVKRSQIETLATCQFIRDCATVLLQGPPGVGKTHLAVSLGMKAIENRFSVSFYRLSDLLWIMKKDRAIPPQSLRRKKYMKVSLLIIDEVGFEPMSREEASLFFRLISHRYLRGATIITTNKSIKDWPEIMADDEVMTTAILDRLLHKSHVLNVKGRSYRLKDLEELLAKPKRKAKN